MTKVHPNAAAAVAAAMTRSSAVPGGVSGELCSDGVTQKTTSLDIHQESPVVLTVWKKSLLLSCNGFTVFDCHGNLVYRVDNYSSRTKDEILLMDAAGTPLLTIRRKKLSLGDKWLVLEGEGGVKASYSAKKHVNLLNTKCLAQLTSCSSSTTPSGSPRSQSPRDHNNNNNNNNEKKCYEIEGSYSQRCCKIYDEKRRIVAEIKKKEAPAGGAAFGTDVFRLVVVQPHVLDTALAMAFVILLDQMFGSSSSTSFKTP